MAKIDEDFCKKIPKVELHAHLNGSISQQTLKKLYQRKKHNCNLNFTEADLVLAGRESYDKAFKIFEMLGKLVTDLDSIKVIAEDVISEFYLDNVFYLELRSTPKALGGCSKDQYILAIIKAIRKSMATYADLQVSLLLSIDRGRSLDDAKENVELAKKYNRLYPDIVVGVELSGDPACGDVNGFVPLLLDARQNGLKMVSHVGEVENELENLTLLQLNADRIGHAVYIHPSHGGSTELFEELKKHHTPVEICLSSNISGGLVQNLSDHPVKELYEVNHPFVFCTDDKGLFDTTLSKEYFKASQILDVNQRQLWKLSEDSINYISASNNVKEKLRKLWKSHEKQIFGTTVN